MMSSEETLFESFKSNLGSFQYWGEQLRIIKCPYMKINPLLPHCPWICSIIHGLQRWLHNVKNAV